MFFWMNHCFNIEYLYTLDPGSSGPYLFTLLVDGIADHMTGVNMVAYADDMYFVPISDHQKIEDLFENIVELCDDIDEFYFDTPGQCFSTFFSLRHTKHQKNIWWQTLIKFFLE